VAPGAVPAGSLLAGRRSSIRARAGQQNDEARRERADEDTTPEERFGSHSPCQFPPIPRPIPAWRDATAHCAFLRRKPASDATARWVPTRLTPGAPRVSAAPSGHGLDARSVTSLVEYERGGR